MINQKYIVAIIYTIALFLDRLDLTIINIVLPTVSTVFQIPITSTDSITLSFLIALAISIPFSDWLSNKLGYKLVYIGSIALFGLGSTLCFFATRFQSLVILRFIQGIGGGILIPVGMTLIYHVYDRAEYSSITSFTFLPALIAPAIAPALGGILLDHFGWRFVFVFSGPICLALALFASFYMKTDIRTKNPVPFDWLGFIYISFILIITFFNLSAIGKYGLSIQTILLFSLIILFTMLFILHEKKYPFPLFNLNYFKNDIFIKTNFIQLCFQICHFGAIFLISMYLQVGIAMSATIAGLIMGMQAIGAMTTSRLSVKLFNEQGPQLPIILGLLGVAVLTPCIMLIKSETQIFLAALLFFMRGIFSGLCGTPIQTLSVLPFAKSQIGPINSIFNACRQISISLGIAISSVIIALGLKLYGLDGINDADIVNVRNVFTIAFWFIPLIAMMGIFITLSLSKDDIL